MNGFTKFAIGSVVALLLSTAQSRADLVVYYSFTSNQANAVSTPAWTNATLAADVGPTLSSFSNFHTGTTPLTILAGLSGNLQSGFVAGNAISQNGWDGNASYFQFTLNGTGYQSFVLSWAANKSGTGPTNTVLEYSTDGGANFSPALTFTNTAGAAGRVITQDLSAVTALNNNSLDVFRFRGIDVGAAGGTWKLDNFTIDGIAIVPEPSTVLLVGMGLVGLFMARRRRQA